MKPASPSATQPQPHPSSDTPADAAAQPIASESLLQGQPAVTIRHRGVLYRLHETRAGKLILTK
ncbi:MAG: hemin uptake protein HemP [Rhodocyclaceae bacterium]|nr:hemin uptake protein HemP [Rhodocyclaceae bacterium]MCB1962799.1 hemin uptake protein HemP [Rhodocyclaceae bacterium]